MTFDEEAQALLAAGDAEQLAIEVLVPTPVQPELGKGEVVGDPVATALRLGDRAVEIEEKAA